MPTEARTVARTPLIIIPFDYQPDGTPVVRAYLTIRGKLLSVPLDFAVDTGAPATFIVPCFEKSLLGQYPQLGRHFRRGVKEAMTIMGPAPMKALTGNDIGLTFYDLGDAPHFMPLKYIYFADERAAGKRKRNLPGAFLKECLLGRDVLDSFALVSTPDSVEDGTPLGFLCTPQGVFQRWLYHEDSPFRAVIEEHRQLMTLLAFDRSKRR